MRLRQSATVRSQGQHPASAVIQVAQKVDRASWYKDAGLRKMMFWMVIVFLTQVCTGYDATLTSNLQSFKKWKADMGHPDASQLGLLSAMYFIGTLCGSFPGSFVTDKFGRKLGLAIGQSLTIIGAAFQAGSQSHGQYMGARFILGFGIAFVTCAGPTMLSELAHPSYRGVLVSFFNPFWYLGSIIAAWTCFGTSHMSVTNTWAWRIPSLLQAAIPCIILPFIVSGMPESPRWLAANGRREEAVNILAKYHANGDLNDSLVATEIAEIDLALQQAHEGTTWKALATNKSNRHRLSIVICMTLMTLWCMQNLITYWFSSILTTIGITATKKQTAINGGLNIANLFSSICGAILADRYGRRVMWISSFIGMITIAVPFIALSAKYVQTEQASYGYGVVVCLFLYDITYNVACNPLLYSYPTELMPFYMRTKGLAVKNFVGQVALVINMYVNPIAIAAISYYYYIVYLGFNCMWLTLIFMYFPETKGYSLEELAFLFDDSDEVILQGQVVAENDGESMDKSPEVSVMPKKA